MADMKIVVTPRFTDHRRVGPIISTMAESSAADDTIKTIESSASLTALPASVDVADVPASLPTENGAAGEVVQKLLSESAVEKELNSGNDCEDSLHRMQTLEIENNNSGDKDGGLIMVEKDKEDRGTHQSTAATSTTAQSTSSAMETNNNNVSQDHDDSDDENHISGASDIDDSSDDDSSSMEGETSLDNSLSLTDLNMSNSKSSTIDNNNTNDNDDNDGVAENNTSNPDGGPLPKPPRHFLCPIQNTLLVDPVIDREGHTYERDAILRWLVLTSHTFDGDASNGEEKGGECKGRAISRRGRSPLSSFGRGTSPITGNPMSVEELVEDKVVKGAIERWRKECWVRFLLGNKGYNAEDDKVKFLLDSSEGEDSERGRQMERDVKDKKVSGGDKKPTSGNNGGKGLDDLHTLSGHKGSATSGGSAYSSKSGKSSGAHVASSNSQSRKSKSQSSGEKKRSDDVHRSSGSSSNNKSSSKSAGNNGNKSKKDGKSSVPHVVSPSPTTAKSHSPGNKGKATIRKQNPPPPPPPPKELKSRKQDRSSLSNSQKSTKRKGLSSISSSQKTAVTSNTTLTAHSTPSTIKPHSTSATSSIPLPPLASPHTANSKSKTSSSESPHASPITSPKVPIKNIHTSSSQHSSFSSNLSDLLLPPNSYDAMQFTSANSQPRAQHNGWSVPLGVHKVICAAPGLRVTTQIHRRSIAVKVKRVDTDNRTHQLNGGKATLVSTDLIIPPGSYIEILETQVHGDRVRGRICWEEEEEIELSAEEKKDKQKKGIKKRTSRLLKRTSRKKRNKSKEVELRMVRYEGWISLQWAKDDESNGGGKDGEGGNEEGSSAVQSGKGMATDEDSGPWTEPVPLGVYRINFAGGLPLRETPERDSTVLGKLDRGRCVEVVQTQVKGDRVRARVIVPTQDEESSSTNMMKFTSGWISLLNAITGSSGASPVPLGAYVVVAEPGCVITEGGGLGSKVKGTLVPGSCMEVVATRMEEGVVRGLIDGGGHVTLFVPPRNNKQPTTTAVAGDSNEKATTSGGRKNADGGRMFAMPVPLGTYQIIQNGLSVTTGISSSSSILMKLQLNATAEIVETRVEDGRVRGRICAVTNEDGSRVVGYEKASAGSTTTTSGAKMGGDSSAGGWINLFEPNQRWAKIVCFKGGRPVGTQRRRSSAAAVRAAC